MFKKNYFRLKLLGMRQNFVIVYDDLWWQKRKELVAIVLVWKEKSGVGIKGDELFYLVTITNLNHRIEMLLGGGKW